MERQYHYIDQQSPEWFKVKLGKLSASGGQPTTICVSGKHPSGLGTGALTLAYKKAAERITMEDPYQFGGNQYTENGNDWEKYVRESYTDSIEFGTEVSECGFVSLGDYIGCSPDGLVGEDGTLEIKVPEQAEYLRILKAYRDGENYLDFVNKDYISQIDFTLWVTDRLWCDLVFFTNHAEFNQRMITIRIERDEERIEKIREGAERFVAFVKELEQLNVV
jgi:hypothetical protein